MIQLRIGRHLIGAVIALQLHGSAHAQTLSVTNGLQVWLKADAGITTNAAGHVVSWLDQSGQGNLAVQPVENATPRFVDDAVNGRPAIHFDERDDYLEIAASTNLLFGNDITSFFVIKFDDFNAVRPVLTRATADSSSSIDYY